MTDTLTRQIIGAAIEVHKQLERGLLESIYENALCYEFELRGIEYKRQVEIDVIYKGKIIKGQKLDVLVENEVVVELKSLMKVPEYAIAQTLSYLKANRIKTRLINKFRRKKIS